MTHKIMHATCRDPRACSKAYFLECCWASGRPSSWSRGQSSFRTHCWTCSRARRNEQAADLLAVSGLYGHSLQSFDQIGNAWHLIEEAALRPVLLSSY